MKGSITKKKTNGLYYPVIFLGVDHLSNKKRYKWGHGHKSKKDAEQELRTLLQAYDNQDDTVLFIGRKEYSTLYDVFLKWKELIKHEGLYESGTSYDTCIGNIQKHIIPKLGEARIDKIELKHIRQAFASMEKDDGTPLSNATKKKS
jgi:tRNA nucleotidyltransferase/poly(A) polymerase